MSKIDSFYKILREKVGERKYAYTFSLMQVQEPKNGVLLCIITAELFRISVEQEKETIVMVANMVWDFVENIQIKVDNDTNVFDIPEITNTKLTNNEKAHQRQTIKHTDSQLKTKQSKKQNNPVDDAETTYAEHQSFDNFIEGPSNNFALNVAKAIAGNPGTTNYNPCFIYGRVGLGKTHLLHAIAKRVKELFPKLSVRYITAENFINDFVHCVRKNQMGGFKNKYRKLDLLLIDDIQFLSEKEGTQDELFHTFNALSHEHKQMVFSSDRALSYIKGIEERLLSRFQSGISVDLQPPNPETAMSILMHYLEIQGETELVSTEIIEFISTRIRNNIRDMLGFLRRVTAYSKMTNTIVALETIKNWAMDVQVGKTQEKGADAIYKKILQEVANFFELGISDLKSGKRNKHIVYARRIATYYLREHTALTYESIAEMLKVSHPSIMNAYQTIDERLRLGTNEDLQAQIRYLNARIFE